MDKNIVLSEIVLDIIDNGHIVKHDSSSISEFMITIEDQIELMNILIATHKQRLLMCYEEQSRNQEVNSFLDDCHKTVECLMISDSLLQYILLFSACQNYRSGDFRNICVQIAEQIDNCKLHEIQYAVYQKMVSAIIFAKLYSEEPFISILRQSKDRLSDIISKYGVIPNLRLLE